MVLPDVMFRPVFLGLSAMAIATPASAQPDGRLDTIPLGRYECALPGSAAGAAWIAQDGTDFTIGNASSYDTSRGSGTYLATKKVVTFTRGPLKGMRFARKGRAILQEINTDGSLGRLRCVREGGR